MQRYNGQAHSAEQGDNTNELMDDLIEELRALSPEEFEIYYKGINYGQYGRRDKVPNSIRAAIEQVYQERGKEGEEINPVRAKSMSQPELQRTDWEVKGMMEQLREDQARADEIEQQLSTVTDQQQRDALIQERDMINQRALELIPRIIRLRDDAAISQGGFGDEGRLSEQKAHDQGSDLDGLKWAKRSSYDDEAHEIEAGAARVRRESLENGDGAGARKAFLDQEDFMIQETQSKNTLGMPVSCGEFHHAEGIQFKSYEEDTLLKDLMFAASIGITIHGVAHSIVELVKINNYNKLVDAVNTYNKTSAMSKATQFQHIKTLARNAGIDLNAAGTMDQQVQELLKELSAHEYAGNITFYTFKDGNGVHNAVDTALHQAESMKQGIAGTTDYWLQQLGTTLGLDPHFPKDFMADLVQKIQQGGGVGVIENGILSGENLVKLLQQFNPTITLQTLQHINILPDFVTPAAMGAGAVLTEAEIEKRKRAEVLKKQLLDEIGVETEEELINNPAARERLAYILKGMRADQARQQQEEPEDERDDDDDAR